MMNELRPSADEVLAQARQQFLEAARGTVSRFEELGAAVAADPGAAEALSAIQRELHRLNGSAATFGFPRMGRLAAALESAVKKWSADPALDPDRRAPVIARFLQALRVELAGHTGEFPLAAGRRLFIVGLKDVVAVPLTTEAGARGFQVERLGSEELDEALAEGRPDGVIAAPDAVAGAPLDGIALVLIDSSAQNPATVIDALEARIAASAPAERGAVLMVDDDPVMRTLVQVACKQANLGVTVAGDAAAFRTALTALSASSPTVVVIDIEVGEINGLDLVRETRANAATAATPILVLSGHADAAMRASALAVGATDYLMKPISLPMLTAKLAAWGTRAEKV